MAKTVAREGAAVKGRARRGKARVVSAVGVDGAVVPAAAATEDEAALPAVAEAAARPVAAEAEVTAEDGAESIERAALAQSAVAEAGGLSPLGYLLRVMRDEGESPARRMDAAKTAAPFLHPKLATMDVQSAELDTVGGALLELIERAQGEGGGVGGLLGR